MPAEPVDYSDDRQAVVYVRVPGWLHNLIVRVAEGRGLSVNGWAAVVLKVAAERDAGLPAPPVARAAVPSRGDVVVGFLLGRTVLEPCGRVSPCERASVGTHRVGDFEYCNYCRIRIS